MSLKIKPSTELPKQGWKILLHGQTGAGKTHLAATSPSCLLINTEGKLGTLKGFPNPTLSIAASKDPVEIIEEALPELRGGKYSTFVLDSFSSLGEHVELSLIDERQEDREEKAKKYGGATFGSSDSMEMKDWGSFLTRLVRLLKQLPELNVNVICTCHSMSRVPSRNKRELYEALREVKDLGIRSDIEEQHKEWQPKIRGQLGEHLGAYFDVIGFMEPIPSSKRTKHRVWFDGNEFAQTKNCGGRLPNYMDDPTMSEILAILNGEVSVDETKSEPKAKVGKGGK